MKISVTLSDELHAELKDYAKYMGEWTVQQFIKHAAVQFMRRYPQKSKEIAPDK